MPDNDPTATADFRPVEHVYHNAPARLLSIHIGDEILRTTFHHPFFVRGQGWVAAGSLQVGDQLRTPQGRWVAITDTFDNGDIEPVFNLRVADHHTYFVGDQTSVLVHNESAEGEEPVAEGQPNGVIVGQESQYAPGVDLYDQNGRKLGTLELREGQLVVVNNGKWGELTQPIEAVEKAFKNGRGPKDLDRWFMAKVAQHLRGKKYNQMTNVEQQQVQQQLSAWKNFLDSWLKYEREGGKISGAQAKLIFQAIATVRELEGIIGMHDWGGKTAQESDYIPAKAAMRQKLEAKLAGTRAGSIERMYLQEELELC